MQRIPIIGAHVSAAGGVWNAIANGEGIGASAIQIYGASPRAWEAKPISPEDASKFKEALKKSRISKVYLHAAYLVNLASGDDELYEKSIKNLTSHLKIAETLGADGLIFHAGSAKGIDGKLALKREIAGIKTVLKNVSGKSLLIIENSAGGGAKMGSGHEAIGHIFKNINSSRFKVCFDTAHALESGEIKSYTDASVKKLFDEWNSSVGIQNIVVMHINDSKTVSDSHNDRHENIGKGYIGISGFKSLAGEKRILDKAWILEVPGFLGSGPDKKNIDILNKFFK